MQATSNWPAPNGIPIAQGDNARVPPSAIHSKPVSKYHVPAASIGRGRKRHDENIPRLKTICQSPGSIHCADGTKRTRTMVRKKPAKEEGKNCATAMRIITSDRPE